ncbi:MAG: guanylate kinase [Bacteroidia bacterium]|nr:guanylate kinase [Bacteroidia bacterium]
MKSKHVLFCGPSGSGKTTIVSQLIKKFPFLTFSISATTRPKRDWEVDSVDYYFLSVEDFKKKIANNEFVEYEEVYTGRYYGTLHSEVDRANAAGKSLIFDVDVKGGVSLKKKVGDRMKAIFVKPPSIEVLKQRLIKRNSETSVTLEERIERAKSELEYEKHFDYVLINDDLKTAYNEAVNVLNNYYNFTKSK